MKVERHILLFHWWAQDSYHLLQRMGVERGQENSDVVSCFGADCCVFEGPGKEDYANITKVCYLRCTNTMDNFKIKTDLCQGSCRPRT